MLSAKQAYMRSCIILELVRQSKIGAGDVELDMETGLLMVNADIDICTLARQVLIDMEKF